MGLHEFKKFMYNWSTYYQTSSPHYPQANGKSERTVQTVKNTLKKCIDLGQDFQLSLLNFRATPRNGLDSPAQILMGRRLNTRLPVSAELLSENVDNRQNYKVLMSNRDKIKKYYDRSAKPLKPLYSGDKATLISDGVRKPVLIVSRAEQPRSYIVTDEHGKQYRRTRSQLVLRTTRSTSGECSFSNRSTFNVNNDRVFANVSVRRRKQKTTQDLQRAVLDNESDLSLLPQPETNNMTITSVSSDSETQYDSPVARSSSEQSSPPAVTITRSKERTARMLKD